MHPGEWRVERRRGSASELLAYPWDQAVEPTIAMLDVVAPALVLGSTQSPDVVDRTRAEKSGVELTRRLSGGGAVLVEPARLAWVEVVVPSDHPRSERDVGRAAWWLGEAWADALDEVGVQGGDVHTGAMARTPWSSLVCFAGMGAGEVSVGGRKVVGISQRRVRAGTLFQCAALLDWNPAATLDLLVLDDADRGEADDFLRDHASGLDVPGAPLEEALVACVRRAGQ